MPTRAFVIKFPDGDFEYDFTRGTALSVGQTLRRRGSLWSVTGVDGEGVTTVYVEPADPRSQPPPVPPAGDDRSP
ncbi:MAG TPA: hypothetical protein VJ807_02720 [Gaiellaceae bacterium]|nr:hypothetical protein [Gaiellaceae bacterium]